jgi:hypothetical protein
MRAHTGVRKCPFHNLALATIRSDKKSRASLHPTFRDRVLFKSCLRVIHLRQIRFDRSGSRVVIHASKIQKSERVERSKRSISPVTAGLWLLVVGILSPETAY